MAEFKNIYSFLAEKKREFIFVNDKRKINKYVSSEKVAHFYFLFFIRFLLFNK